MGDRNTFFNFGYTRFLPGKRQLVWVHRKHQNQLIQILTWKMTNCSTIKSHYIVLTIDIYCNSQTVGNNDTKI